MNSSDSLSVFLSSIKRIKDTGVTKNKSEYNNTEMRLIGELILSSENGKRVISTNLADSLGVTRSAVSQMVKKLEKKGVIKRVNSEYDKKIAYIEFSPSAMDDYKKQREKICKHIEEVTAEMGEENMAKFIELIDLFSACQERVEKRKQ